MQHRRIAEQRKIWSRVRSVLGRYAYPLKLGKRWIRTRGLAMRRRSELQTFFSDIICWAGENAIHSGQFTRDEVQEMYLAFGKKVGLTDLLPRQLGRVCVDQVALKGAIMNRIGPEARAAFKYRQKLKKRNTRRAMLGRIRSQLHRVKAA